MRLSDIAEIIIENVEKLLPYLRDDVKQYLAKRKEAGVPNPTEFPTHLNEKSLSKWIDIAVEWALRADPRYIREIRKEKPLSRIKAPFVKQILKWWLDPAAGGGIDLPEDIETTAETLNQFNVAKQHGLNANAADFTRWDELVAALQPFLTEPEEADSDIYSRMGLDLVFHEGPWKMYTVDKWIPGDQSTLHPGQVCHRAFEGTRWCVKYQSTFERTYSGVYYLVLYRGKRFGLINFPSKQFKNPQDQAISKTEPELGLQFLQLLFNKRPDFLAELALAMLDSRYSSYSDFAPFMEHFTAETTEILNTPEAREGALRDPMQVIQLAKFIGEWPHFRDWPEGYQKIVSTDFSTNTRRSQAIQELVEARGRVPEVEAKIDSVEAFKRYCVWLTKSNMKPGAATDLIAKGREISENIAKDPTKIRGAISWLTTERGLRGGETPPPWPNMEQQILRSQDPRAAFAYAKLLGEAWPEGESLIASDDRSAESYFKLTGKDVRGGKQLAEPTDPDGIVRRAIARGKEIPAEQEDFILQDLDASIDYAEHLIGPWPELEDELRKRGTSAQKKEYSRRVLYGEFQ